MRPLAVITGVLPGSCVSITVSLAMVLIVFLILGDDYPRLQHEFRPRLVRLLIFFGMTILAAGSFDSLIKMSRWRFWSQGLTLAGLAATVMYYWP